MTFADLLINTCTTQRYTAGAADGYGQPAKTWTDHLASEPCRLVAGAGKELKIGAEVVIADYKLFLGDVDIIEQDKVIIDSVEYEVLLVADRQDGTGSHHKECFMRTVR